MIAPSTRYVPLLLGLAALLSLPMARTRFEVRRVEDCARPQQLLALHSLPGFRSTKERYEKYDDDLSQWTEIELASPEKGTSLRAAMIRSFRATDLYSRPPVKLLGAIEASQRHVEWVEAGDDVLPIQTLFDLCLRTVLRLGFTRRGRRAPRKPREETQAAVVHFHQSFPTDIRAIRTCHGCGC